MMSKEIQKLLKKKGIKDTGIYFVSFVEEFWSPGADIFGAKVREDIGDWHNGRIEIRVDDYEYDIEEIRFFTKSPSFVKFRDKWDFKDINAKQLDELERITKKYYQNTYDNKTSKRKN